MAEGYMIEVDPRKLPARERPHSDIQYRAVASVLGERGYPGGPFRALDGFTFSYNPGREIDTETVERLEGISGVKVKKL